MGLIQAGKWVDQWYDTKGSGGAFKRQTSAFRHHISAHQDGQYVAESGRYHLFVSYACPWAHRALIFRAIKGLSEHIDITVVSPLMLENGWQFDGRDPLHNKQYLYELYLKADPNYEGRVTVPVLWDKRTDSIVNNESAEIIRIFNSEFNALTGNTDDYYPQDLREEIDIINTRVYNDVNNGVYKAGFATDQGIYEAEYARVFDALDWLDQHLAEHNWLVGNRITEADWRLFTTLLRFDSVYHGHFKLNRQRLSEFRHLPGYVKRLANVPGVAETINIEHIKHHYYVSQRTINPSGIVPVGPASTF